MTRIILLGCAGGGKTTLARRLGERTGAPVVVLDEIWPPPVADDLATFRAAIGDTHAGEAWISDGNFAAATFDLRLPRADLVIWLDRPQWVSAWRAVTRVFRPGEHHKPANLGKVLAFIWNFDRINRPRIEAARLKHGPDVPVVRLTRDREIAAFVESLGG